MANPSSNSEVSVDDVLWNAQRALRLNQKAMAARLGVSVRSLQRWSAGETAPKLAFLGELAKVLLPVDRALAERVASLAGTSIESLEPAPALDAPAARAGPMAALAVEGILYGAAQVLGSPPDVVRRGVLTAFQRAMSAGLSVEDVVAALGG